MEETEHKEIEVRAGAVQVNNAYYFAKGEEVIAVGIDLKSKYANKFATGSDGNHEQIFLSADENTLEIAKGKTIDDVTVITFVGLTVWSLWSCDVSRYTAHLCFTKTKQ